MFGTKRTKQNVVRTGVISANLVSVDMLELMDYFGMHHAADGKKDDITYDVSRGEVLDVPVLDASRWVYECEVERSVEVGGSTTFFAGSETFRWTKASSARKLLILILQNLIPLFTPVNTIA